MALAVSAYFPTWWHSFYPLAFVGALTLWPVQIYLHQCNTQEQLEAVVQQENCDIFTMTEAWWDGSHRWRAAMDGHKLFRMDMQGRREGGEALHLGAVLIVWSLMMIPVGLSPYGKESGRYQGESLLQTSQDEEADEKFYRQLGKVLQLLVMVHLGYFYLKCGSWSLFPSNKW